MNLYINYINIKNDSYLLVVKYKLKQVIKLKLIDYIFGEYKKIYGIKEQMNTIPNRYNKWLYLFHILVAKITRKTEITKKRSAVMLLFF